MTSLPPHSGNGRMGHGMMNERPVTRSLTVSPHEEHRQNVLYCLLGHGVSSEHVDGLTDELLRPENAVVFESFPAALSSLSQSIRILESGGATVDVAEVARAIVRDCEEGRL